MLKDNSRIVQACSHRACRLEGDAGHTDDTRLAHTLAHSVRVPAGSRKESKGGGWRMSRWVLGRLSEDVTSGQKLKVVRDLATRSLREHVRQGNGNSEDPEGGRTAIWLLLHEQEKTVVPRSHLWLGAQGGVGRGGIWTKPWRSHRVSEGQVLSTEGRPRP